MSELTLDPISAPFVARVTPPGSKSLTNRALVLASLATGSSELRNVLFADDTLVMLECLQRLGFQINIERADSTVRIEGSADGVPSTQATLFCGNSGTTIRFLTALCALGRGHYNLDGIPRMRQRPIQELVVLLNNLGARISYGMTHGFPPVDVAADGLPGGLASFGRAQSSQYLSAVLQVAPYARNEVRVQLHDRQTSWPYIAMTMRLMDTFGVTAEVIRDRETGEPRQIIVPPGCYGGTQYLIEPDASNASYFLAVAAIHPEAKVTIEGLGKASLQGDVGFADLLRRMGAKVTMEPDSMTVTGTNRLEGIDADLSSMPDMAQTLAVTALFADGPTRLTGLHTLRVKETDRISALATELTKLGGSVHLMDDTMTIEPPETIQPARIATYDDHRMAMSFAVAGSRVPGITILDPQCVNKTYPHFFQDLMKLTKS